MSLFIKKLSRRRLLQHLKYWKCSAGSRYASLFGQDEYNVTPEYPPIEPMDKDSIKRREEQKFYDLIKRQNTVEEKQFAINLPRLYGWKCYMIKEGEIPFDNLKFTQHVTRTHLIEAKELPDCYKTEDEKCSELAQTLQDSVKDIILYHNDLARHRNILQKAKNDDENEEKLSSAILEGINEFLVQEIRKTAHHLKQCAIDYEPRHESAWKVGTINQTLVRVQNKDGLPLDWLAEEYCDRPSDGYFQYVGRPFLQLRHANPLPAIIDDIDKVNINDYPVPKYEYDPFHLGYELNRRHLANIPGFWPEDPKSFSLMSYHLTNHMKQRPHYDVFDLKETLQCQAMLASFGWLMSLSCYHGFSTYQELTYPIVTQTILTNAQEFTFAVYQMNTTELFELDFNQNPRCNLCWVTPTEKLYEKIEDGKITGFNEDVLKNLVQFYINSPRRRDGVDLNPYLGKDVQIAAHYDDPEKRGWLEQKFKKFISNKYSFKTDRRYEVYDWERIYKIDHATRPMDRMDRPYMKNEQPYHVSMDNIKWQEYIPKALRPDKFLPKKSQRKIKRTFFPK